MISQQTHADEAPRQSASTYVHLAPWTPAAQQYSCIQPWNTTSAQGDRLPFWLEAEAACCGVDKLGNSSRHGRRLGEFPHQVLASWHRWKGLCGILSIGGFLGFDGRSHHACAWGCAPSYFSSLIHDVAAVWCCTENGCRSGAKVNCQGWAGLGTQYCKHIILLGRKMSGFCFCFYGHRWSLAWNLGGEFPRELACVHIIADNGCDMRRASPLTIFSCRWLYLIVFVIWYFAA